MTSSDRYSKTASSFSLRPSLLGAESDDNRVDAPGASILAAVRHGNDDEAVRPSSVERPGAGAWRLALGIVCLGTLTAVGLALRSFEESSAPGAVATPLPSPPAVAAASAVWPDAAASASALIETAPAVSLTTALPRGEADTARGVATTASTPIASRVRAGSRLARAADAPIRAAAPTRRAVAPTDLDPDAELVAALIARLDRRGAEPVGLRPPGSAPRPLPPASAPLPAAP